MDRDHWQERRAGRQDQLSGAVCGNWGAAGASPWMDTLWTGISWVARIFASIGGAMIMVAAVIVSAEVISRKLLALPFSGSDERRRLPVRNRHQLVDGIRAGDAWSRAHRCALWHLLSVRARTSDLVALLCLAALVIALADRAWELVADNRRAGTAPTLPCVSPFPPYPQLPWFFGFALFLLAITIAAPRALLALVRGDYAKVAATVGASFRQDEEVKGELEGLGIKPEASAGKTVSTCSAPPCSFSSSC